MPDMEEVAKRRRSDGEIVLEKGEETLDAKLWGKLQDYIPLHIVYEKLPLEDRLRLRVVCKAWNHSALERVEPKPYFVTIALGYRKGPDLTYLNGLVKYDGEFSFELQPFRLYIGRECEYECARRGFAGALPLEVEGLIICCHPYDSDQQGVGVYNVHTKTWHAVPPAPETSDFSSICGMMVDTSERPYAFRLVVGSVDKKTQVYDSKSRSWSTTSSIMVESALRSLNQSSTFSCMCYNGCVYIPVERSNLQMILVYSMDEDSWTTLDYPFASADDHSTLGVWEGRIFTIREDNYKITVWELVDVKKQEWVEYACCPEEEYDRLLLYTTDLSYLAYEEKDLMSVFCDEYLLIYNWHYQGNQAYELLMFNLETKKWIPVGLPRGTVSTPVDEYSEFSDEDDEFLDEETEVDDVDDVDEVDEFDEVDEVDGDGDS